MSKPFYFIALFGMLTFHSTAQTTLPAFFANNMVLQQKESVAIWGMDNPNTTIKVSGTWGGKATARSDENGRWKVKLPTPAAGGPYAVVIQGTQKITLQNVLIGEVWLCSGQSNMEMPVKGFNNQPVIGSNETILNSANDQIRYLNTPRSVSLTPLYDAKGEWKAASPATTGNFSATAYYFAKKLHSVLHVPIGIIHTSWGASSVESWMDKQTLAGFKQITIPDTIPSKPPQQVPTIMFNSMLHPYIGFTIRGVIWYQGESNRENAGQYQSLFSAMIQAWRAQWQQGDFPFYFVQIAPFEPVKSNAAFLREAQLKTMQAVKNTGMAVTLDIGEQKNIHPAYKEQVGTRLAYWALAKDYTIPGFAFSGPIYKQLQNNNNGKLTVTFEYAEGGLTSFDKPLTGFEVAGEDRIFYPAEALINGNKLGSITVWSDSVKNPVSVRYGFKSWVEGRLYNTQGLPASSFRTDDW